MNFGFRYKVLVISLVLIILLLFLVSNIQPKRMKISDINKGTIGKEVLVKGIVKNKNKHKGNLFFNLNQGNSSIDCVQFNSNVSIKNDKKVLVMGDIQVYRNELEIIVNEIYNR